VDGVTIALISIIISKNFVPEWWWFIGNGGRHNDPDIDSVIRT